MCGIAGIISSNKEQLQLHLLQKMAKALEHRGPDGEGFWINEYREIGFAHKRLAILDLSNTGKQPMHYLHYTIIFNGAIYNYLELKRELESKGYVFTSTADTEIIPAAYDYWGKECLQQFDGMFAFAIWNEKNKELFIARDRFGEKPLYYHTTNTSFVFASEMKGIWATGITKTINNKALLNYLGAGMVSNPNDHSATFYQHIQKLPAAHYLIYSATKNDYTITRYWNIEKQASPILISESESVEQFKFLLQQSVTRRLRSDVAVGTSLSGGLDSSSIVASIQKNVNENKQSTDFKTFSAVFHGFEKDESAYIQEIIKKFHLQNFTTTPTAQDFIVDFEKLLYHQEEPFQSSSIYAQHKVYQLAKQHGVTVLLDGQGADETLAGYTKYYHWFWQELLRKGSFSKLYAERKAFADNNGITEWGMKNYMAAFFPSLAAQQLSKKLTKQLTKNNLLTQEFIHAYFDKSIIEKPTVNNLEDILHYNTFTNGLEDLLRYADRNSMAFGREIRLPFLYHELVQFIFSLPGSYKIKNGFTKYILRVAMQNTLPQSIVWRKDKIGFEPPQQAWLQQNSIIELTEVAKNKLIKEGIINKAFQNKTLPAVNAHHQNNIAWWVLCSGSYL